MNLPHEDAQNKKLEAKAQLSFSKAMDHRAREAEKEAGIERDKFGGIIGETAETPDMVRWFSNGTHYFLKHNSPGRPIFALGMEHQIGDLAYIFDTSIEFDDDEAPDLMDHIAEFNVLPKYTSLKATVDALRALVKETDRMARPEDYYFQQKLHGILEDLDLEG